MIGAEKSTTTGMITIKTNIICIDNIVIIIITIILMCKCEVMGKVGTLWKEKEVSGNILDDLFKHHNQVEDGMGDFDVGW